MGIFNDLFGNGKNKFGQALGFFVFIEEQEQEENQKCDEQERNLMRRKKNQIVL